MYLLLTVAYVVSGKLGLMLALPPGYSSPIFPPAGIAVAAVLIGGRRTLPWIFLGSLLLNVWVGYSASQQINTIGIAVATIIAIASMLQAATGGWGLRRVIGYPASLDHSSEVLSFLLLAPVICLISASLSVSSLLVLGIFEPTSFVTNWAAWWVGDTLGVVVMLPLVMIVAGEPRALWQRRKRTVAVPMLLVFTLFVMIFLKANQWEYTDSLMEFRQISQQAVNQIQSKLGEQETVLEEMAALFIHDADGHVTREEFHRFVEKSLLRFPMIQALEWASPVNAAHRTSFEASQRKEFPDFEIRERNTLGQMQRAGERASFYPVTYIEPLEGNEPAMGFDLASTPERQSALTETIKSGTVVITPAVHLVQEHEQQVGALLLLGVDPHDSKSGVVLTVLRMGDFMDKLLLDTRPMINTRLVDLEGQKIIYDNFVSGNQHALYEHTFNFGTRLYRLETAPTPAYVMQHHGWQSWSVLAAGILGTGLLGALFLLGTGYTARIEAQVEDRSRKLRESESRYRNILDHAPIGMAIASLDGQILQVNHALCTILGYKKEELEKLSILEITHPDDRDQTSAKLKPLLGGEIDSYRMEKRYIRKDGQVAWALVASYMQRDENGVQLYNIGQVEDITERKLVEQSRNRLARELKLLSDCNAVLVRSEDEHELLTEICRLAVGSGDYLMAWVGVADHDANKTVRPTAQYGYIEGYLDNVNITWADTERGRGSTGTAIRTGEVAFNDTNSSKMSPWRDAALKRGYKASIALPLFNNLGVWGALTIYSKDTSVFSKEEVELLDELAKDISFGIEILRTRIEKKAVQHALNKENEKYLALLRNASDGIHIIDTEGNIIDTSDSFCTMLGYQRDEMIGMNVSQWDAKFKDAELSEVVRKLFLQHGRSQFETLHRCKDGTIIDVEVSSFPLELGGKPVLFSSSRDITERKMAQELLRKSSEEIEDLYNHAPCGYHSLDKEGGIVRINDTELEWLGYARDEVAGKMKLTDLLTPESCHDFQKTFPLVKKRGFLNDFEVDLVRKDGTILHGLVNSTIIYDDNGEYLMGRSTVFDITERKKTEETLRSLFTALESGPIAVIITDADANIQYVNPRFSEITGYDSTDVIGHNLRIFQIGRITEHTYLELWNTLTNDQSWHGELLNKTKQGRVYWEDIHITPVKTLTGSVSNYVVVSADITQRKEAEERMQHMANYDPLTDLPNRSLVDDRLRQTLSTAKRDNTHMALMFIDLDKFKPINDTLGHDIGDHVLKEAAKRMQGCVRESDTVGRIGGDEFVVLLPIADSDHHAMLVAEKIRHALNQPFILAGQELHISSSIGIAIYPEHGDSSKALVKNADTAMYFAKKGGRNNARLFRPEMLEGE